MCTFSEGNGRFLIAIITTNIVQCLWATDNTLGVMKSLNSRLSPTSSSRLKCHGLCWPDHRNGKHKRILPTSSSKALETWASFPRNGGYQIHHVCLGSLFFPIFNYSGIEEKKREREMAREVFIQRAQKLWLVLKTKLQEWCVRLKQNSIYFPPKTTYKEWQTLTAPQKIRTDYDPMSEPTQ